MQSMPHRWSPDWPENVIRAVRETGFSTLTQFLASLPCMPYPQVCERLPGDFAPIQLVSVQYREARESGDVRATAIDALCRKICQHQPDGWGVGDDAEF